MFGVTLHATDPFNANLISSLATTLYKDEEFMHAFNIVAQGKPYVSRRDCLKVLEMTCGMIPLVEENLLFADRFGVFIDDSVFPSGMNMVTLNETLKLNRDASLNRNDDKITREEFHEGLADIRGFLANIRSKTLNYTSFQELKDDRRRHSRRPLGPECTFICPMTAMQQVGWHDEQVRNVRYPNNSCEETRYQKEFIRTNWGAF